jgi:hypothetical protein
MVVFLVPVASGRIVVSQADMNLKLFFGLEVRYRSSIRLRRPFFFSILVFEKID